jgi:hypothetical protein
MKVRKFGDGIMVLKSPLQNVARVEFFFDRADTLQPTVTGSWYNMSALKSSPPYTDKIEYDGNGEWSLSLPAYAFDAKTKYQHYASLQLLDGTESYTQRKTIKPRCSAALTVTLIFVIIIASVIVLTCFNMYFCS